MDRSLLLGAAASTAAACVLAVAALVVKKRDVVPLDVRLNLTLPSKKKVRWGFMGAGRVAHDFANALKTVEGAVLEIVGTASSPAAAFQKRHGFKSSGSYADVLASDCDIVYLSAMHSQRVEHVEMILNAGKPALVEKPFACSYADAKRLFDLAKSKNLFIMEGMWTRFFPAVEKVRELIDDGVLGRVTCVISDFGFDAADSGKYDGDDCDPIYRKSIGGGALLWAGPYPIAAGILPFGAVEPARLSATGVGDPATGVELSAAIGLQYDTPGGVEKERRTTGCPPRGATVSLFTGIDSETAETTVYVGQNGRATIKPPGHCPTSLVVEIKRAGRGAADVSRFDYPLPTRHRKWAKTTNGDVFNYPNSAGFAYEAAAVQRCLAAGLNECPQYTTEECLKTIDIIDRAKKSIAA